MTMNCRLKLLILVSLISQKDDKMKRLILLFCLAVGGGFMIKNYAQFAEPSISFNKTSHNFGNINELDGIKSYEFEFINNGSQPLILYDVTSTCGCTIPEWNKEPIPPGGKGKIKVTFDPHGRPGAFRKPVNVKSNARESAVTLYIVGMVNPKPRTVADDFPSRYGKIRLSTNHVSMMTLLKSQVKTDTVEFFNDSDSVVTLTFADVPAHLSLKAQPASVEPKKRGVIYVTYDAKKNSDWGFAMDRVFLNINGVRFPDNFLAVSCQLSEDFSKMSADQKAKAPKASLSEDVFNFGTINAGQKVTHDFILKNAGQDPLVIRKISTTCGCTASEPDKYEIPGGGQTTIKCTFDSRGKNGKQFQTVTMITNDPMASEMVIRILGTVQAGSK